MQDLTQFISNHLALTCAFVLVLVLLMILEFIRSKRHQFNINVARAVHLINRENAIVIDTRGRDSYEKGHILDSLSISSSELTENSKKIEKYRVKPIIIVCNAGVESQKVAASLIKQGYNTYSLSGGIRAWADAQMPLVKG